ncbi:uncharacterized protein LOC109838705 [Asparagus officinalis]|uniref:uncharacterized protein LOC109838705 n=1 Tax=Asparagus officinalis TaxID=4686 RepID=UPI00098E0198|nr:uncharacterized protein LOC109838705 [Asparagus officinalis]
MPGLDPQVAMHRSNIKLGVKPVKQQQRATDHALAGLLAQDDENGHEQAVYYLSRTLLGAEPRYPLTEKECLALPSALNWRPTRWALLLSQCDIHFKPQKAVKGQDICDLMSNHPLKEKVELYQDIPDETYKANVVSREQVWQLYFDESCSNNVAEYNALLVGLDIAKQLGVKYLEAYGDSQLIVNQIKGEYEVRNEDLIPHHTTAITLADSFEGFYIDYIPHLKNTYADALASLMATLDLPERTIQQVTVTKAILLREVKTSDVVKFLKYHIVYRIKNLASTAYNPTANGQAETFNKTIVRILTKVVSTNK